MDLNNTLAFLKARDRFLLTTHVNPDADGIGAMIGMIGLLEAFGKNWNAVMQDPPQEKLSFLEGVDRLKLFDEAMKEEPLFESVIYLDAPGLHMIGAPETLVADNATRLNIDHHVSNKRFADINLVDTASAATAQIVAALYERAGITPAAATAKALYAGLSMDTGRFRFDNTTPAVFRLAASLVEAGADPYESAEKLYYRNTLETKIGRGKMLESIELHKNGKVATAYLDYDFLGSPVGRNTDTEGFVNDPLSVNGVEIAVLIREEEKGKTRLSVRSSGKADANALAGRFGGGGHQKAAGCKIDGDVHTAKRLFLDQVDDFLK